jgi:hypothetical protein
MKQPLTRDLPQEARASRAREIRAARGAPQAFGALALGAIAIGAVAIGALAIGRLAIGRARIRRLEIDELVVGHLRVTEGFVPPTKPDPEG